MMDQYVFLLSFLWYYSNIHAIFDSVSIIYIQYLSCWIDDCHVFPVLIGWRCYPCISSRGWGQGQGCFRPIRPCPAPLPSLVLEHLEPSEYPGAWLAAHIWVAGKTPCPKHILNTICSWIRFPLKPPKPKVLLILLKLGNEIYI